MKKKQTKILLFVFLGVIGAYLLLVGISAVMMSQMTRITYSSVYKGEKFETIIVDFEENTVQQIFFDRDTGEQWASYENSIDISTKNKIKATCSFSLFPLWRKSYFDRSVYDGIQYSITRTYGNGESIVSGSNAYPLTYDCVMRAIRNAVSDQ